MTNKEVINNVLDILEYYITDISDENLKGFNMEPVYNFRDVLKYKNEAISFCIDEIKEFSKEMETKNDI